jgi:hypothetical protein
MINFCSLSLILSNKMTIICTLCFRIFGLCIWIQHVPITLLHMRLRINSDNVPKYRYVTDYCNGDTLCTVLCGGGNWFLSKELRFWPQTAE